VIAIIAVLAGLIAAAAVNAMRAANRGRITLEIKNISGALENFKNDYGAYPPNGMHLGSPAATALTAGSPAALVKSDFARMFKKAFPRHQEPAVLIDAIAGISPPNTTVVTSGPLPNGLTAAESLYFWLGGFSSDEQFPLSGEGGPSFADVTGDNDGSLEGSDEILENRNRRYEFDIERLAPRNDDGLFDESAEGNGRFVEYLVDLNGDGDVADPGEERRINLWRYNPSGSGQPLVYFDTSRYKPAQYDLWAAEPGAAGGAPYIFAMKQLRSGGTTPTNVAQFQSNVVFVDQGKFQILHPGLDDAWGVEFERMSLAEPNGWGYADFANKPPVLYPEGPFIGEIGDTLTSFTDGTLEDAVEE
jgi:type II secretory pathway pseudopilin PulG